MGNKDRKWSFEHCDLVPKCGVFESLVFEEAIETDQADTQLKAKVINNLEMNNPLTTSVEISEIDTTRYKVGIYSERNFQKMLYVILLCIFHISDEVSTLLCCIKFSISFILLFTVLKLDIPLVQQSQLKSVLNWQFLAQLSGVSMTIMELKFQQV